MAKKTYEMRDEKNEKLMVLDIDDNDAKLTLLNGDTRIGQYSYRETGSDHHIWGDVLVFLKDVLLRKKDE